MLLGNRHGLFPRFQVLFIFYEVVLGGGGGGGWGGVGCSAFEMQKPKKKFKRGVQQVKNLVCKVGLPQIVL